jgi:hypothetical protein
LAIKIKRVETNEVAGHLSSSDEVVTYFVIDDGKEFTITFRSFIHGCSLGLAEQQGILHTDEETQTVHRRVAAPAGACGLNVDDEPVDGLSSFALRGVISVYRSKETREITLTTEGTEANPIEAVILIDGKVAGFLQHL